MKNDFYLQEQIDAFLSKQLPEAEHLAFGAKIQKDPLLKQEVEFQQDIINALQQHRKVQLKSRLQHIEMPPVNHSGFLKLRWGAIATGIVVVATSGLLFYKQVAEPTIVEPVAVAIQAPAITAPPLPDTQATIPVQEKRAEATTTAPASTAKKTGPAITKKAAPTPSASLEEAAPAFDSTFEQATHPGNGPQVGASTNGTMPNGQVIAGASAAVEKKIEVKLLESKDNALYYQYYNNKLFLYGDFKKQPYALLEIHNAAGKMLYMHHDSAFYQLENNRLEPVPLKRITNKELQQELKQKLQSR